MASNNALGFLGAGISFPLRFFGGGVAKSSEVQHVEESLRQILGTAISERIMRRDWGSNVESLIFSPNDPTFDIRLRRVLIEPLRLFEPRVNVISADILGRDPDRGIIFVNIDLSIRRTNQAFNITLAFSDSA